VIHAFRSESLEKRLVFTARATHRRIFRCTHGVPWIDDQKIVIEIAEGIYNGRQWKDAPKGDAPGKRHRPSGTEGAILRAGQGSMFNADCQRSRPCAAPFPIFARS
jgi:hypothetical protein